jgi:hypothetical protein
MMASLTRSLAEVTEHAIRLLTREMGVADTMRFLNQFAKGSGNYTEEREALLGNDSLDEILTGIRKRSSSNYLG